MVFFSMLLAFTGLFFWMLSLRVRCGRIERRRLESPRPA
jgi:hypothetical protein